MTARIFCALRMVERLRRELHRRGFPRRAGSRPQALLIYNDYHNKLPGKREKHARRIKLLRGREGPLQATALHGLSIARKSRGKQNSRKSALPSRHSPAFENQPPQALTKT